MLFPEYGLLPARFDGRVSVVTDPAALPGWHALLKRLSVESWIAWDTETSGFDYFKQARIIGHVFGFDLGDGAGPRGVYFPIRHATHEQQLPVEWVTWMVQDILGDPRATIVGHNLKFDLNFAAADGIVCRATLHDTMIMVALLDENRPKELESCVYDWGIDEHAYEMKSVVQKILTDECKRRGYKKSTAPGFLWIPPSILGRYGCKDGYNSLALAAKLLPQIHAGGFTELYQTEMDLTRYLQRAEFIGTPLDIPYLQNVHRVAEQQADTYEREIHQRVGFDLKLSSDVELRRFLYESGRGKCGFPVTHFTEKGRPKPWGNTPEERAGTPSCDSRAIKAMIRLNWPGTVEFLQTLLKWREQDKILSTYTTPMITKSDANGVLHTSLNQVKTNTGRLSSSGPNLQNIKTPDDEATEVDVVNIQRAFLVPEGMTRLYLDFSQIELRVLAFECRDPTMVAAFINKEDIHTRTSMECFNSKEKRYRRIAKVLNFGISYGMSAMGVMENLNDNADPANGIDYVTEEQAQGYLDRFHKRYPRVSEWCRELYADMRRKRDPHFVNRFGRHRRIPEMNHVGGGRGRAERQAVASFIQGEAADINKVAMVRVGRRLEQARALGRYSGNLILTVHDENQIDVETKYAYEACMDLKADMEHFPQFQPIDILAAAESSSTTWADKKPVKKAA